MTIYTADQLAAHARTYRAAGGSIGKAIATPAEHIADRIAELMPDSRPDTIGAVLLHAGAAVTQIVQQTGQSTTGMPAVIATTLLLAGEHLYSQAPHEPSAADEPLSL